MNQYIVRSHLFKCSLEHARKAISTSNIFDKLGCIASEEVTLQQFIASKCIPGLLYGLEACSLLCSNLTYHLLMTTYHPLILPSKDSLWSCLGLTYAFMNLTLILLSPAPLGQNVSLNLIKNSCLRGMASVILHCLSQLLSCTPEMCYICAFLYSVLSVSRVWCFCCIYIHFYSP